MNKNLRNVFHELNKEIVVNLVKSTREDKDNVFRVALTVPEVASLLRLNNTKIYKLVKDGIIPSTRFGNRIIIPITAFIYWLDESAWDKSA